MQEANRKQEAEDKQMQELTELSAQTHQQGEDEAETVVVSPPKLKKLDGMIVNIRRQTSLVSQVDASAWCRESAWMMCTIHCDCERKTSDLWYSTVKRRIMLPGPGCFIWCPPVSLSCSQTQGMAT
mmetsp:Transcript_27220/g.79320  ORF Transcript_27220/g.79320 Transcript_27220/m.79320 type:complete len:126 (-) Transcript_27220:269-646(-)